MLALDANFPGFLNDIRIGKFHVLKGDINEPFDFGGNKVSLLLQHEDDEPFHIMPAVEGAGGNNGWFTVILGVVLIAATWYVGGIGGIGAVGFMAEGTTAYQIGMALGASLVLSGASQLLSPTPQVSTKGFERESEKPSFVFNGPVNRTEQGGPVTLVYGEITTGSIVVGGSIDSEEYT